MFVLAAYCFIFFKLQATGPIAGFISSAILIRFARNSLLPAAATGFVARQSAQIAADRGFRRQSQ